MKKTFTTILLAVLILPVLADGGNKVSKENITMKETTEATIIMGTVVDQSTGEALPGAQVKINGLEDAVYTDFDGNFEVRDIKSGTYTIKFSLVSYEENKIQNLVINSGKKNALKVELKR